MVVKSILIFLLGIFLSPSIIYSQQNPNYKTFIAKVSFEDSVINLEDKFIKLLIENLPEDKVREFEILIKVGDKEKIQKFISSILPDIETILAANLKKLG